jgi:hypothetical protein
VVGRGAVSHTFKGLGRRVRKGHKIVILCNAQLFASTTRETEARPHADMNQDQNCSLPIYQDKTFPFGMRHNLGTSREAVQLVIKLEICFLTH